MHFPMTLLNVVQCSSIQRCALSAMGIRWANAAGGGYVHATLVQPLQASIAMVKD